MQPAAGAIDLNPQQVEINSSIANNIAETYRLWGYEKISPPIIERLDTLMAGDGVANADILKIVSDDQLGLRPEMTTSISRASATRFNNRTRPLRLWSSGPVFKSKKGNKGATQIEESNQIGVELYGVKSINAELELISLLLDSLKTINFSQKHEPTLLIGNTELFRYILSTYDEIYRVKIESILTRIDRVEIEKLSISNDKKNELQRLLLLRGDPKNILMKLEEIYGQSDILKKLSDFFNVICSISSNYNIKIQFDPTFKPHYNLYNGFVFQLICKSHSKQVTIAKGGRYDKIVRIFEKDESIASGVGFTYSIDKIRELITEEKIFIPKEDRILITYKDKKSINLAFNKLRELHSKSLIAMMELSPCNDEEEASSLLTKRNCNKLIWITKQN